MPSARNAWPDVLAGARRRADHARLRARLGLRRAETGGFHFGPVPPPVHVVERSPDDALSFLRSDPSGPNRIIEPGTPESADLRARVGATTWYHTIDLPEGVTTPGIYDHRSLVPRYYLPERLDGQDVLDVATFDGFWAFELERRGGNVTALDLPDTMHIDLPPAAKERGQREDIGVPIGTGFAIASSALHSAVKRREGTVYELDPDGWGQYDLVHLGDLLLHLERPLEALRRVRSVTKGTFHLSDAFDPALRGQCVRYLGGWNDVEWWIPSLDTLCQWLVDADFCDVKVLGTYQINTKGGARGFWRAIIRSRGG